jgi:Short C-terminal domain
MGLIGGIARTAVVAGTATAVSNRTSRRQANRWAEKDQAAAYQQQQYAQQYAPPPQYAQPQYAQPQYAPAPPPAPAPAATDTVTQLKELAELKNQGILTEAEFQAQKAKILASS